MFPVPLWSSKTENPLSRGANNVRSTQPAPSKQQLIHMLNEVVQQLLSASACSSSCDQQVFGREHEQVRDLCRVVDRLLCLGLLRPAAGYWPAVSQFLSRAQRQQLEQTWQPKSQRAYSLCWLYDALNASLLEYHMRCFAANRSLLTVHYAANSFATDTAVGALFTIMSLLTVADYLRYIDDVQFGIRLPQCCVPRSASLPQVHNSSSSSRLHRRSNGAVVPVATRGQDTLSLEAKVNDSITVADDPLVRLLSRAVALCEPEPCDDALTFNVMPVAPPAASKLNGSMRRPRKSTRRKNSFLLGEEELLSSLNLSQDSGPRSSTPKAMPCEPLNDRDEESLFRELMCSTSVSRNAPPQSSPEANAPAQPTGVQHQDKDRVRNGQANNWIMDETLRNQARAQKDVDTDSMSSGASRNKVTYEEQLLTRVSRARANVSAAKAQVEAVESAAQPNAVVRPDDHSHTEHRLHSGEVVQLALQVFEDDSEHLYKMYGVLAGVQCGEPVQRWLIISNARVYICSRSAACYSTLHCIGLELLHSVIVCANGQSVCLLQHEQQVWLDTADQCQTRGIVGALEMACRRAQADVPCVVQGHHTHTHMLSSWLRAELQIHSDVELYTLVFWRLQTTSELRGSNNNNDRKLPDGNASASTCGYMYSRTVHPDAWYGKQTPWTQYFFTLMLAFDYPMYFVLGRKLYVFSDSSCREGVQVIDLRHGVAGCRESSTAEQPNCVDILLMDDAYNSYVQLATATKQQARQWLNACLTAISAADDTADDVSNVVQSCALVLSGPNACVGHENSQHGFVRTLASLHCSQLLTVRALTAANKCALLMVPREEADLVTEAWWVLPRCAHELDKLVAHLRAQHVNVHRCSAAQLLEESQVDGQPNQQHKLDSHLMDTFAAMPDYWALVK